MMRRPARLLATILALLALAAPAAAQQPSSPSASLSDIEDEVMCPICGTALNLSQSPQAERERVFIRELIAEGRSKDEIKDALVAEYGPEVLATPDTEGFDLAAWIVPGAAILLAAGGIAVGVRRWRRQTVASPAAEPPVAEPEQERRLSEDLRRYEL